MKQLKQISTLLCLCILLVLTAGCTENTAMEQSSHKEETLTDHSSHLSEDEANSKTQSITEESSRTAESDTTESSDTSEESAVENSDRSEWRVITIKDYPKHYVSIDIPPSFYSLNSSAALTNAFEDHAEEEVLYHVRIYILGTYGGSVSSPDPIELKNLSDITDRIDYMESLGLLVFNCDSDDETAYHANLSYEDMAMLSNEYGGFYFAFCKCEKGEGGT